MFTRTLATTIFTAVLTTTAFSQEVKVGDLIVANPVARATPPGAKVGGGYITITNTGSTPDRLLGGTATFTGKVEIHEMKMTDDIMRMKQIKGGLEIPAGDTVKLMPGGNHIMFMHLKEGLKIGQNRKVTLIFEKAGNVDLIFNVKSIADTIKMGKKKMKMDTDG